MTFTVTPQTKILHGSLLSESQVLYQYAVDTWQSFVALTYPGGLPADNIRADGCRARHTSPTTSPDQGERTSKCAAVETQAPSTKQPRLDILKSPLIMHQDYGAPGATRHQI